VVVTKPIPSNNLADGLGNRMHIKHWENDAEQALARSRKL